MRILVAAQQSPVRHPVPAYDYWMTYLRNGLAEAGHECVEIAGVDWAEGLACAGDPAALAEWRDQSWSRALAEVRHLQRDNPIDLFLGYFFPPQVDTEAVAEVRGMGVPIVNFFCDNVREFRRPPAEFAAFDLHWVPEKRALEMYRIAGLRHLHAPMPVWVAPTRRRSDHPETYGVTFIGSRDVQRERLFAEVIRLGARVELRGDGWATEPAAPRSKRAPSGLIRRQIDWARREGVVSLGRKLAVRFRPRTPDDVFREFVRTAAYNEEYATVLQQSEIALGVNRFPSFRHSFRRPESYSRLRDIEAPMLGACYLTEWTDGLDELYEPGREIESYRTPEEMVAKIDILRRDPSRRRELRRLGQQRALGDHTIGRTIGRIAAELGIGR